MTYHLLDSDAIIDTLHGIASTVFYLEELFRRGGILCTNAVVLCEVYAGVRPEDEQRAEAFLSPLPRARP